MEERKQAIAFIDGNNFYHNLKNFGIKPSDIDFHKLGEAICEHFGATRKQTRYYNSLPDISEGKEKYYAQVSFFDRLKNLPKFEVYTRKLQRHSKKEEQDLKVAQLAGLDFCKNCRPLIEANCRDCIGKTEKKEKGVDVMIAVDIVRLALDDGYNFAILVSGDADFIPALEVAQKRGKEAASASVPRGYSSALRKKFKYFVLSREFLTENCLRN